MAGARVVSASAADPLHPAAAVTNDSSSSFFAMTGMFPHEIVLQLNGRQTVSKLKLVSKNIKRATVLTTTATQPMEWKQAAEWALDRNPSGRQVHIKELSTSATFLKIVVQQGWEDFACIHAVEVL